jgi:hypothetical protein
MKINNNGISMAWQQYQRAPSRIASGSNQNGRVIAASRMRVASGMKRGEINEKKSKA